MDERTGNTLDKLVMRCLDRYEGEGPAAIEALCAEHPEAAAELRRRMEALLEAGLLGEPSAPPERLGEFRLGRRLGGGGMGVVYAAVQEPLGREVALKIVRPDRLYFSGARERFRREVQIIARLAHAGIVPVYTVGEEQGVPYFAMERLRGATLAEALAVLDGPPREGSDLAEAVARVVEARDGERIPVEGELFAGSGVMASLRIVQHVSEALAHAHERGVLHRDLKPSNVMLTTDGRALLFDFGLASSRDSASLTDSGSRVGSLTYMAPEQVQGEEPDERADVYGLGAILCEALTGRPPHEGAPAAVTAAILAGDPGTFARWRRRLPRDVVTIVETAMAHDPGHRYASASDLGRDLGHVLARRPIEARPAGPLTRAVRWMQRHPTRATLLALVIVAPLLFSTQQYLARERIAAQSARAEANLDQAVAALRTFVWDLGIGVLEDVPHFDASRLALLEEAVATVGRLAEQRPDDALLNELSVRSQAELGEVFLDMGRLAEADAHFRAGLEHGRRAGVDPRVLVTAQNGVALVLERMGRWGKARDAFHESARLLAGAEDTTTLIDASTVQRNLSRLEGRLGRVDESRRCWERAVDRAERAVQSAVTEDERFEASYRLGVALSQTPTAPTPPGEIRFGSSDAETGAATLRGLTMLRELAGARPGRSDVVHALAVACSRVEQVLPVTEVETFLQEGLGLVERLQRDFPDRASYGHTHMVLAGALGNARVAQGRPEEARVWFERASTASEPWLERDDEDLTLLMAGGVADLNLATNLVQIERRRDACGPGRRAAERFGRVRERAPDTPFLGHSLAWARIQEGYGRLARGEGERTESLADAVPVEDLEDAVISVAVGELYAGCADLATDPVEMARHRDRALERLALGLELGFPALEYLRSTPEWTSLRDDPRFEELLAAASG